MKRILFFCALVLLPSAGFAQEEAIRSAALGQDSARLEALVAAHRLEIKPVVRALVTESAAAKDPAEAARLAAAAALAAERFEATYGETSLTRLTRAFASWDADARALKVHADTLLEAGIAMRGSADTRDAALENFLEAQAAYREIGDVQGLAEVAGQIGYVNFWIDRSQYLPLNEAALEARRDADDQQLIGNSLNDVGLGNRMAGDFPAALEAYREAETIRRAIGDSLALSRLLPNIGIALEGVGDYEGAHEYYLKGGDLYLTLGDTARWIGQRSNAAGIMTDYAGRHSEALGILLGLEDDLDRINDARSRAVVLLTTGIVNRRLGNYQGAVENYREAIRLSEENGFDDLLGRALNNIGVVYIFLQRADRAVPFLERALLALPEDDTDGRADAMLSLSSAHFWMEQYDQSEEYASEVDSIISDPGREASVLKMRGDIRVRTGRPDEAYPFYEQLMELADRMSVPNLATDALFGLGEAAERSGRVDEALAFYEGAAETLESARGLLRAEEDKAGYLAQTRYLYEETIHFLVKSAQASPDRGYGERAFEFSERSKSRAFLDQLAESLARVKLGVDPELRSDLDVLGQNMAYLRQELAAANPATDRERIAELKGQVGQMEDEYDRVERDMRERNPRFAAIQYPRPVTVEELQSSVLQPGELLLAYALGDSSSTLWAVSTDAFSVHRLPVRADLEAQVDLLRFALGNPDPSNVAGFAAPARRLFDILLGPAAAELAAASELILVPDGALHYVPFESLLTADGGDDFATLPYVLQAAPVSYVQSASVLRQLRLEPRVEAGRELLAIGDPAFGAVAADDGLGILRGSSLARLPFSGTEVSNIADLFDAARTDVLLGDDATEARVKALLDGRPYRFVHFATHGLVNDDRPDYSALALAGSGPTALLEASEIFNLSIQADLVVLSACETGLGQLVKGEGMVGLTRAFMYAGAPSVMVSLWSVSDRSTSELMQGLYGSLVGGDSSKSAALRSAKQALLEDASTAHPFHWAPFVLVGRSD